MTTRVTVLGTDAQTPGVWTGPQSMVQPSPLLGDDGGAGMLADATSQAIPNTLALRDADASFAVRALGLAAGAAFPAPDSSFAQIYYDQATRLFTVGTVAANFIVSGSAASEGASRLDIGGDKDVADELSLWASAADLDGPRIAMAYAGGTVAIYSSQFTLGNLTGSEECVMTVDADGDFSAVVDGGTVTLQGDTIIQAFNGSVGQRRAPLYYGTTSQTGATTGNGLVIPMPSGSSTGFNFYLYVTGFSADGLVVARQMVGVVRSNGAAATVVNAGAFYSNGDAALAGAVVAVVAGANSIVVECTGVAGKTIRFECYLQAFFAQAA